MGRGSRSREMGVKKQTEGFSRTASGRSSQEGKKDECLFSFQATLQLAAKEASGITNGSPVTIIPHHTQGNQLELFIETKGAGDYKGPYAAKILRCIRRNYIYEGFVTKVKGIPGGVEIQYRVEGKGR